jgi:hypothetical protein
VEEHLATPDFQVYSVLFPDVIGEKWPVPETLCEAEFLRPFGQIAFQFQKLPGCQSSRPAWVVFVFQRVQAAFIEFLGPTLDRSDRLTEDLGRFLASHSTRQKQNNMQTMEVTSFRLGLDFLFDYGGYEIGMRDFDGSHGIASCSSS